MRKVFQILIVLLAIIIGIISLLYLFNGVNEGYLELKSQEIKKSQLWWAFLYTHIATGSLAILIGWIQFSKNLQTKFIRWHRTIGKIYILASLPCAVTGFYVGFHATGGWIAASGFMSIAIIYFYTTLKGYLSIRTGQIVAHQNMMTYSYSLCLAAVTLRIYIPLSYLFGIDYILAYSIIAWVAWLPNLCIARWINQIRDDIDPIILMNANL